MERRSQGKPIRIQELAARTGVSKSTIHYYLERRLLPPPLKTSRTSAFYDESCIERIRLIRGLQKKAYLPLGRIKRLLDTVQDVDMLENVLLISAQYAGWVSRGASGGLMSESDVVSAFGFTPETLVRLEDLGVLNPENKRGNRAYHPEDVEILKILEQMNDRGFSPARGWPLEALSIYVDGARRLAENEVEQLFKRMTGGLRPRDIRGLFGDMGEDLFLGLFLWMRRKAMRKIFSARLKRMGPSAGAAMTAHCSAHAPELPGMVRESAKRGREQNKGKS